jgi:hypothetical protein
LLMRRIESPALSHRTREGQGTRCSVEKPLKTEEKRCPMKEFCAICRSY